MTGGLLNVAILIAGIGLLLLGGDLLVRGATSMAARFGVRPLTIGLTVVAFGTSAPELSLNLIAASTGHTALSLGNVVGSNIANIGLIVGLTAMLGSMRVHSAVIKRELPIMILVTAVFTLLAATPLGEGGARGFTRVDAAILLAGFVVYMLTMLRSARKPAAAGLELAHEAETITERDRNVSLARALVAFAVGLALLVGGGKAAQVGAVGVARAVGLSEQAIGLTVVAVATSLPELATSIMAIRRKQTDIAIGNIVGSNLFNLLLVMGATAMVTPVAVPHGAWASIMVMGALSLALWPICYTGGHRISRLEGLLLLVVYVGFMALSVWPTLGARAAGP